MMALARSILVVAALFSTMAAMADDGTNRFEIVVCDTCLFSEHDIVSYELATHRIVLTEAAHARRRKCSMREWGRSVPFAIKVDGEVVYSGMVVTPLDSWSHAGPVITTPVGTAGEFTIRMGHGEEADPRNDRRIIEVLWQVGVPVY